MSPRNRATHVVAAFTIAIALAHGPGAIARIVDDLPETPPPTSEAPVSPTPVDPRSQGVGLHAVPEIRGPGRVTNTSRLWLKATNIGIMGNAFPALSSDPSAQWPGPSGIEHLFYWGLWVGAAVPGKRLPEERYRVSQSTEWRPPTLDPVDRIYTSFDGIRDGLREKDDDGDGKWDEDFHNGKDDDGDGLVDEDYAAISQRMYSFEMRDDTEQARYAGTAEPHVAMGLRVRQNVFGFEGEEAADFCGTTYEITNVSGGPLDSVFVGFLVDQDVGPVAKNGYWRDDIPEPRIPSITRFEAVPPNDPRYDPRIDPEHRGGFCTFTLYTMRGFTMEDDDGDNGEAPSASCFLLFDHTTDGSGREGPDRVGFHAFHLYRPGIAFSQGGMPTSDIERYAALATAFGTAFGAPALQRPADGERNDWSTLVSIGPYRRLEAGQSIRVTVGLGVWPIDRTQPPSMVNDPDRPNPIRYKAVLEGAERAHHLYLGQFEIPEAGVPTPHENGRESYLVAPPDRPLFVEDCHFNGDSTGYAKEVPPGTGFWFNFGCDYCDAVKGRLPRRWLIPTTPVAPVVRLTPADHRVTIEWDNHSEVVPERAHRGANPDSGDYRFWGYRVYRAAGYERPVGTTGPVDREWELIANLRHFDPLEPLVDSLDADGDGRFDGTTHVADVLLDLETGARYPAQPVPPLIDPDTGLPLTDDGTRIYFDQGCHCNQTIQTETIQYPVGRYRLVDNKVLNGFLYFYTVTAVDSSGARGVDGSRGSFLMREGRRFAIESQGVTPHDSTATLTNSSVYVVPNPYRASAAWDLHPNPADPTGTHVDFFNMPKGQWTLRIFTIAGDLVQEIRNGDMQFNSRPQQESPEDGQASWNLLSRNGQDVTSGIYLFSVTSSEGTVRGKFVIIR